MYFLLYLFFGLIIDLNTKNFVSKSNFVRFSPNFSNKERRIESSIPKFLTRFKITRDQSRLFVFRFPRSTILIFKRGRNVLVRENYTVKVIPGNSENKNETNFCWRWKVLAVAKGWPVFSFVPAFDRDETASVVPDPLFAQVNSGIDTRVYHTDISFPSFPCPLIFSRRFSRRSHRFFFFSKRGNRICIAVQ